MVLAELRNDALVIRKKFLRMHFEAQSGHIGTGLSAIDLLAYLYRHWIGPDDRFILSKGHGASSLYATLNHFGRLPDQDLATYYQEGTLLPAHPAARAWKEIPAATGSLGHGLPIAAGMAYAEKNLSAKSDHPRKITCLLSDGECNEGSTWEAALFAGHHRLGNLTVVVDANGLQGFGRTSEVLGLEPFDRKWEAFGFEVRNVDGHDFGEIDQAFQAPRSDRPLCLIARTIKGKGVSFMENRLEWHYLPMKPEQYAQAIEELSRP